jgi:hypothetical protein
MSASVDFDQFKNMVKTGESPKGLSFALQALWHDARGDWDRAHDLAQDAGGGDGAWVHAYLHRKEGDRGNARYWYSRAEKPEFRGTLEDEWEQIARELTVAAGQ